MNLITKTLLGSAFAAVLLSGCGGSPILSTPIENIDNTPLKEAELSETQKQNWGHLDLVQDTIPGMSVDKAYAELVKRKKGKTVIVAVIDSGIDITHEDLDGVLWTNTDEIAGNGKDDDNNGYIDDIHGWNFLGDAYNEQLEYVRLVKSGNTSDPRFEEAKALIEKNKSQALAQKGQVDALAEQIPVAQDALKKHLGKTDYTKEDVMKIKTEDQALLQAKALQMFLYDRSLSLKDITNYQVALVDQLNYNYNVDFDGRTTGDNIDDLSDRAYGNGKVGPIKTSELHGTHVAGIILAERNNGLGVNGVANNVKLMSIRAVPNGDEYDKDIALAIRYAVDNGAQIINGSFGKSFSPRSEWVRDAIAYAGKNNVIFVHAAGNDGKNVDNSPNFPDDNTGGTEVSNTYIRVGALAPKYGSEMVAGFSNYGKKNVDVFAPGAQIYSTVPGNKYETHGGTSMAAPGVAGVAALVWSQYPNLTAVQIKQIIMDSGLAIPAKVVVGGDASDIRPFAELSSSAKMVNAYNALVMAEQLSN